MVLDINIMTDADPNPYYEYVFTKQVQENFTSDYFSTRGDYAQLKDTWTKHLPYSV